MTQRIDVAGIRARVINDHLGAGGQGVAKLVELDEMPGTQMVLKELPFKLETKERLDWLCQLNLARLSSAFAAPLVCETTDKGTILHLAPLALGVAQDEDAGRALPFNLQICLEFICLLQLLEENGLIHGDIAPSNVFIAPDGTVYLIDFDGFLSFDPDVPPPDTIGQRPMLAPEQRNGTLERPTKESGLFQAAMLMSMILTGHYPTQGLPSEPAAVDKLICQGHWPEHDRIPDPDDLPIKALGAEIVALFDRAFGLDPTDRPSLDEWRRALTTAVHNCWIHDCGEAFVSDPSTNVCPGCGVPLAIPQSTRKLKIQVLPNGPRYGVEFKDRTPIVLGRATMPGLPLTVSGRHLEILPFQGKFLFRHVGSNPTLIKQGRQWFQLQECWVNAADMATAPVPVVLADTHLEIQASA